MRLALKISAALAAALAIFLWSLGISEVQKEVLRVENQHIEDQELFARAFSPAIASTWRRESRDAAVYLINYVSEVYPHLHLRWVSLDPSAAAAERSIATANDIQRLSIDKPVLSLRRKHQNHQRTVITYALLSSGIAGANEGALEMWSSLPTRQELFAAKVRQITPRVVVFALIAIAVSLGLGLVIIWRPTEKLIFHLSKVSEGDFSRRVDIRQKDELGRLASSINHMTAQLQESRNQLVRDEAQKRSMMDQLRHADRLSTIGQLAAGVAHELGTPLNVAAARARFILDDADQSETEAKEHAQVIFRQTTKMTKIISQLMSFARADSDAKSQSDLAALCDQTVAMLEPMASEYNVKIACEHIQRPCEAFMDADQIQQVLTNLVVNAIHASDHSTVTLRTNPNPEKNREIGVDVSGMVLVEVEDQGCGMSSELLERIFDPFVTTKDVGQGTGLGLSVAHGILQKHGGHIRVRSKPQKGSIFFVYLPRGSAS